MPEETESHEIVGFYCFDDGVKILRLPYKGPEKEYEFPVYTKGKHLKGQGDGCLMIPRYAGT